MVTPHQCCGLCAQGRRLCPSPEACHLPAAPGQADPIDAFGALAARVVVWVAVLSLIAAALTAVWAA